MEEQPQSSGTPEHTSSCLTEQNQQQVKKSDDRHKKKKFRVYSLQCLFADKKVFLFNVPLRHPEAARVRRFMGEVAGDF